MALFAAGMVTFTLLYSPQVILPDLVREFGVSPGASTLALSLTTIGLGLALLVAGPLSDSLGRTVLVRWSLAISSVVAVFTVLAPSWHALLALRLAQGIALAGLPAVATAYLREEVHGSAQARAAGLYIGGTALGGMTGRLLTGLVAEAAGWRWALATTAVMASLCTIAVFVLLPASQHFRPAARGVAPAVRRLSRALADPRLALLYLIGASAAGAVAATFNVIGFRLADAPFHLGVGAASLVFLSYPLGTISATAFGRMAGHTGRGRVLAMGIVVSGAGVLLSLADRLWLVGGGLTLLVVGYFAAHAVASGWVPARAHAAGVATAQAASLYLLSFYAGSSVFGSLGGTAWSHGGWPAVSGLSLLLLIVAAGSAVVLERTKRDVSSRTE
ncbi:MAG: MFS transporter [Nocardioidaceae bacterium]|nr:MFS transporter [Nocardioidaceae bacterium]